MRSPPFSSCIDYAKHAFYDFKLVAYQSSWLLSCNFYGWTQGGGVQALCTLVFASLARLPLLPPVTLPFAPSRYPLLGDLIPLCAHLSYDQHPSLSTYMGPSSQGTPGRCLAPHFPCPRQSLHSSTHLPFL